MECGQEWWGLLLVVPKPFLQDTVGLQAHLSTKWRRACVVVWRDNFTENKEEPPNMTCCPSWISIHYKPQADAAGSLPFYIASHCFFKAMTGLKRWLSSKVRLRAEDPWSHKMAVENQLPSCPLTSTHQPWQKHASLAHAHTKPSNFLKESMVCIYATKFLGKMPIIPMTSN